MIYTKVEIAPGVEIKIDIDQDEFYTICPSCGIEHHIEYDLAVQIEDWSSSISCGNELCNKKLRERIDAS